MDSAQTDREAGTEGGSHREGRFAADRSRVSAVHPPLELQVTDDRSADAEVNLRRLVDVYEKQIRAHPHNFNWTWVHDGAFESPRSRRQRQAALST